MNEQTHLTDSRLRIRQQNINHAEAACQDTINGNLHEHFDILALQEPYIDFLGKTRATHKWRVIYPSSKDTDPSPVRSTLLVNTALDTNTWRQLDFPSNDVTVIQLSGPYGKITIFNIYNSLRHQDTIRKLRTYLDENARSIRPTGSDHVIWLGDFNRHHPMWEDLANAHLFIGANGEEYAEPLLELIAEHGMEQTLPRGLHTYRHKVDHSVLTRLDNVFCTEVTRDIIEKCAIDYGSIGPGADHYPIVTIINLPTSKVIPPTSRNFRNVDWKKFRARLEQLIRRFENAHQLSTVEDYNNMINSLTIAIQDVIEELVPVNHPCPHTKRWWTKELTIKRLEERRAHRRSFRFRYLPNHPSHEEYKLISKEYTDLIRHERTQHWKDWLEAALEKDLWTANKYATESCGDGGKTRIPTLKRPGADGVPIMMSANHEKAEFLAETFFPPPPAESSIPQNYCYPDPVCAFPSITREQILRAIKRLSPFKAPGIDKIPNVVLMKCSDILIGPLLRIFNATFTLNTYYAPWRDSITAVLRKPGKDDYTSPKAYRPIALLNTMGKLLTAVVAESLTFISETHQLLPRNHFGGRPGRTTTDALQTLTHLIKDAWRAKKVVGVLFLDVEAAFPNAVLERLLHNMKKRRVPTAIVNFVEHLITGRRTKLRFDDFISELRDLLNGIGQGCPASMILYLFYDADLLEVPKERASKHEEEDAIGFVDDLAIVGVAKDFRLVKGVIEDMAERPEGVMPLADTLNCRFGIPKSIYVCFCQRPIERFSLCIRGQTIQPSKFAKYLGIIMDDTLRWHEQTSRAIAKGTAAALQLRRFSKSNSGLSATYMRRLHIAVVLPKTLYAADVWLTPLHMVRGGKNTRGSVGPIRRLARIQRIMALAITGGLRTTANDTLDAHSDLLPMDLTIQKKCHNAMVRMCSLPSSHPLHGIAIREHIKRRTSPKATFKSPFYVMFGIFVHLDPILVEVIPAIGRAPWSPSRMFISIGADRKLAVRLGMAEQPPDRLHIYTDGSGIDGHAGAAAVTCANGARTSTLRHYLGPLEAHTVYESEGIGIQLGMCLALARGRDALPRDIDIHIDNQSIIRATELYRPHAGYHIVEAIHHLADCIADLYEEDVSIRLIWTPGHEGIEGSELVDEQAKRAASGHVTNVDRIPTRLRVDLPENTSAIKQDFNAHLKRIWKARWEKSPRRQRMQHIDPTMPSNSFMKLSKKLRRAQTSMLTYLRTGHAPLNKHLHRIGSVASPDCPHCPSVEESIRHFILECPKYRGARHIMGLKLRRDAQDIRFLLSSSKAIEPLMKFIIATQRWTGFNGATLTSHTPPNDDPAENRPTPRPPGQPRQTHLNFAPAQGFPRGAR